MTETRLRTSIWIWAAKQVLATEGIVLTVVRRGDEDGGALAIKQNFQNGGFRVLSRISTASGEVTWHGGTGSDPVDEARADAYIAREIDRDRDLWVIEIEDRKGRLPFGEKIAG